MQTKLSRVGSLRIVPLMRYYGQLLKTYDDWRS